MNLLRLMVDKQHPLPDMALLLRRAGLEHLVDEASVEEVLALAEAGDRLVQERTAYLVYCLARPHEASRPFDGGAGARLVLKEAAYALSRSSWR